MRKRALTSTLMVWAQPCHWRDTCLRRNAKLPERNFLLWLAANTRPAGKRRGTRRADCPKRQNVACTFEAVQAVLGCQVLPFGPNLADEYGTTRTVGRFMTTELVFWRAIAVQIDRTSKIIGTSGADIAFEFPQHRSGPCR